MLTALLTVIATVLVFGTVVLVHELGHFLAARRCGIHVQEFSIGFGPAVWSRVKKRDTVQRSPAAAGRLQCHAGGKTAMRRKARSHRRCARAGSAAPLPAVISGKNFDEAGPWQRFFVILSGAAMNFVLGYLVLVVLLCLRGPITSCVIYDFIGGKPQQRRQRPAGGGRGAGGERPYLLCGGGYRL